MKIKLLFKNTNYSLLLVFFLLLTASFVNAATRTSTATGGAWATGTTWLGGVAPVAGDDVIIATTGGNAVSLAASISITNVTVNSGATLDLSIRYLSVTGVFTNNGIVNSSTGRIISSGNFTNTGTITFTGAGRLSFGGNYANSGTVTLLSSTVYLTGTANQSIQGFTTTGTVSMLKTGGTATLTGNVGGGGLTINGTGGTLSLGTLLTHTFTGTWTRTAGTVDGSSSLLKIGLSISGTGGVFTSGTGTVEYNRAGAQTAAVVTYNNLILSGSGIKTFATTPTVNGKLILSGTATVTVTTGAVTYGPNATLQYDTTNIRVSTAKEWITPFTGTGGVIINGTNNITLDAAKVFGLNSPLTITSVGKLATGNFGLTFGGNFINNGGTFTAGSSPIVINNTGSQSIAGFTTTGLVSMTKTAGTATFGGDFTSAGLIINGTGGNLNLGTALNHTLTGAVTLTAGTLNGGSSILNVNFNGTAWTGTGSNFTSGTGTVKFGGAAQTLATASTFNNLTLLGSGVKTLTGVPTVNSILSMEGTATVSATPTYGTAATLQYNRTAAQVSGPEWATPFNTTGGVNIINTGVVTANAIKSFGSSSPLNITTGATLNNGGFAISGTILNVPDGATLLVSGTSAFPTFTTTTLGINSVVNYNGTAQTIGVQNYGFLVLSGSGNKTFVGSTTIREDLSISTGVVALLPNGTTSNTESLTLNGVIQTSLGSWGGSGSAATNKNSTWFGSTVTGILNVTTSCVTGTWLGLTNTDWNTVSNWCSNIIPTASTDVIIATSPNQPIIGVSGGICRNITINSGSTLTISGSNILQVKGNWTNNGIFTPNTSTVNFNGTTAQIIGGSNTTTFNNLSNNNITSTVIAANDITVNNTLSIPNNAVLDMVTFILSGIATNNGTGQIKIANTSATPIPAGKTWTNIISYNATSGGQTIMAGTYNGTPSLELNNTSGTQTASGVIITGGRLNIINGGTPTFDMNGFSLSVNTLNILTSNSVLDMKGATLTTSSVAAMDGKVRFSGPTNAKPFSSGTVEYYGTTQTITNGNYFNLLFTGVGGVYTIPSNIDVANKFNITNGAVTVQDGFTLSVGDAVTVVSPGTLTIESNASLLQTTYAGANTGNVIIKRNTTPILRFDSTFWSSPTTGTQTLLNFSPLSDTSQFFTYDSVNDAYISKDPTTTVFAKGVGYSIRVPENTSTVTPTVTPFQFVGVPNNGTFTLPLTTPAALTGLSFIGNPYPSAMNALDFINENLYDSVLNPTNTLQGTLYFWTHNNRLIGNDFSSSDYAFLNLTGLSAGNSGTGNNESPTDYIASGQGFFVENTVAGDLKFNNTMREPNNNTNFYKIKKTNKTKDIERHRIWLDLKNSTTKSSQILIGYVENATNEYEGGYDSFVFDEKLPFLFYSLIGTDKMNIQGRTLPFSNADIIPLGYKMDLAGSTNISINREDGLFLDDQGVYLEDKDLNVIHNLKEEPYVFNSEIGTFNDRFVLRYTDGTLGTESFKTLKNTVLISNKNKQIKINSFTETIDKVLVYDVLGKQIYKKENVSTNELLITNLVSSQQVLVVKTTLQNGKTVTSKIVY